MLGRSLTLAARHGMIHVKPLLARPSVHNARQGFVGRDEIRRLIQALPEAIRDPTLFAYITGWRKQEVLRLTWDRMDMERGISRLEESKNGEGRVYPFGAHPELRRMMERRYLERHCDYVFERNGKRVRWFDRSWKTACIAAGLGRNVLFHGSEAERGAEHGACRGTAECGDAAHWNENGVNLHRRYAITNEEDLARGVRLIAALSSNDRIGNGEEEREATRRRGPT